MEEKKELEIYEERPKESIEEDELGTSYLAKRIKELIIIQPENRRLIIGIDGKIGMGKTTLMNFTENLIKKENDNFIISKVKTWLYKDEETLLEGIFTSILSSIKNQNRFSFIKKALENLKDSLKISLNLGVGSIDVDLKEAFKKSPKSIEEIHKDFEKEIKELPKIIIFLDDLDRCDKEEILFTFKLLREFLYIKKFIFIVGYDKEILKSKVDIDIEKFVDLEISLKIEQNDIINWFYKKLKEHFPYEEIKDIYENETIKNDFESILNEYMDTPRKAKQILNELITLYPLVKNEVYFPHFAIITILRRDIPSLYYYLQEGGFWILQKEEGSELEEREMRRKEIQNIVNIISKKEKKEDDERFKSKIYGYLRILSKERVSEETEPSMGKAIKKIKSLSRRRIIDKAIYNKFYTERYFLYKPPSYSYSDTQFEDLIASVSKSTNKKEKIEKIRSEAEGAIKYGKFESFLELIEKNIEKIYKLKLDSVFEKALIWSKEYFKKKYIFYENKYCDKLYNKVEKLIKRFSSLKVKKID